MIAANKTKSQHQNQREEINNTTTEITDQDHNNNQKDNRTTIQAADSNNTTQQTNNSISNKIYLYNNKLSINQYNYIHTRKIFVKAVAASKPQRQH